MNRRSARLIGCALVSACLMSGCGFRLEGSVPLPASLAVVRLDATDTQSDFYLGLRKSLLAAGTRIEKVTYAPPNTLTAISLDPGDIQDLRQVQPFVLTTDEVPKYYIRYLGRQQLDEISCYTFAVKPKKMESGQRYFEGIVWVDDRDLQIVKSYGRGEGAKQSADHQYGKFETYREQIDGKYWFPTYTISNATLHFRDNDQRIKMTVKYEDYKQFKSDVNIKYDVEDPKTTPPTAPPTKP